VYSSGPGLAVRLIMHCFLGLRVEKDALIVDPVVPVDLDGLTARVKLDGLDIEVVYHTGKTGRGPLALELNGTSLDFSRESNRYRLAGVRIPMKSWTKHLQENGNRLIITLE
jgi:cellobiose phosphorylase